MGDLVAEGVVLASELSVDTMRAADASLVASEVVLELHNLADQAQLLLGQLNVALFNALLVQDGVDLAALNHIHVVRRLLQPDQQAIQKRVIQFVTTRQKFSFRLL